MRCLPAFVAVFAIGLAVLSTSAEAEDPKVFLARFFDGMRERDYAKAMQGFLAIMALDPKPPTAGQENCFAALKTGDAASATAACNDFASASARDPRAHVGVALAKVIAEQPLEAVKPLETALALDRHNFAATILWATLARGGAGDVGDGWAVPASMSPAALAGALRDFERGDFTAAAESFGRLFDAGQVHGKVPLMLYIARKRASLPTGEELVPMRGLGSARYAMLISALTGESTPKAAWRKYMENWAEADDYGSNRFFLGQAALLQGDKPAAERYFTQGSKVQQDTIERRLCRAELARLQ